MKTMHLLQAPIRAARTTKRAVVALMLSVVGMGLSTAAHGHAASDAYLRLVAQGDAVHQRWDIALRDLDRDLVLDADDDGRITWGELRARWPRVDATTSDALRIAVAAAPGRPAVACLPGATSPPALESRGDGTYVVLRRDWQCDGLARATLQGAGTAALEVGYQLFATTDVQHRGMAQVRLARPDERVDLDLAGSAPPVLLDPRAPAQRFALGGDDVGGTAPGGFFAYVAEGMHHIWIGTDHVLFLLALLLPAVLVWRAGDGGGGGQRVGADRQTRAAGAAGTGTGAGSGPMAPAVSPHGSLALASVGAAGIGDLLAGGATPGTTALPDGRHHTPPAAHANAAGWQPAERLWPAIGRVAQVVTAFTVAHSITLALAVLGVVNPPSRWIESIIAASVVLAALDNLWPVFGNTRWKLTFLFGLVHGFGFAGALRELGLGAGSLAVTLLGFNVGVELGQLAIVAVVVPLAWTLRQTRFYTQALLRGGSVLIALLALRWLVERAFDVAL